LSIFQEEVTFGTKEVTLNPSRNTLPLAQHTKNVDHDNLKITQHSLATTPEFTKYSERITLV